MFCESFFGCNFVNLLMLLRKNALITVMNYLFMTNVLNSELRRLAAGLAIARI